MFRSNIIPIAFFLFACSDNTIENDCANPIGSEDRTVGDRSIICFLEDFNNCFEIRITSATKEIRSVVILGGDQASISDIGVVTCLGSITSKPDTGFSSAASLQIGHGYVVKLQDNSYGRLYVDSFDGSTKLNLSWQYAF